MSREFLKRFCYNAFFGIFLGFLDGVDGRQSLGISKSKASKIPTCLPTNSEITRAFPSCSVHSMDSSSLNKPSIVHLILDDFGLLALDTESRLSLLEIIEDRYDRAATIISTQIPVAQWFDIIGDPTLADAICDRLVPQALRINLTGKSMRVLKKAFPTPVP